jgi:hypothetical protein
MNGWDFLKLLHRVKLHHRSFSAVSSSQSRPALGRDNDVLKLPNKLKQAIVQHVRVQPIPQHWPALGSVREDDSPLQTATSPGLLC